MEAEDLKVGDRVVPLRRSISIGVRKPEHALSWREALRLADSGRPYLYVHQIRFDADPDPLVLCGSTMDPLSGDWFHDTDLIPYEEAYEGYD